MKSLHQTRDRRLIFLGDSIFNCTGVDPVVLGGHYIPRTVYGNVNTGVPLSYFSYASSSNSLTRISSSFSTISGMIRRKDIVVINAITNDLGSLGKTANQAHNVLIYICNQIASKGAISVVCTMPARNKAGDPADIETQRTTYNSLVVSNTGSIASIVCDFASDPKFNSQSCCDNTDYYHSDKLHMDFSGSATMVTLLTPSVKTALSL